ncbi:MAG TPA: ROK family protein [Kofleriaceae bacterium]|jgi:fructokinase|nr:ROK family protein [Kofleriaceae bacterium]
MRLGIDLGGTKIEAAVLDETGAVRARRRVATPRVYDEVLAALTGLVAALEGEAGPVASIGVGTPGTRSPRTGLMQNAENTALQGRAFDRDLAGVLGRPVRLANDALCFALSEAVDGAGAGAGVVFGAIVGTGTGGAIVAGGRAIASAGGIGCEWGHNSLPWPTAGEAGVPCTCGRTSCVEAFLSGPGLERDHAVATGETTPAAVIVERAAAGEPAAVATLDRYVDRMARALASVINLVDPDVIVLGGGVSRVDALYTEVPARWGRWTATDSVVTRLVRSQHGDASGVRGAAWL